MDSKFLKVTLLISFLFMVTVFFVVLYANGMGPGQKQESVQVEETVEEVVMSGQIGNDLYGWMEDESFFDKAAAVVEEEEGLVRVNMIATSVEKDMRVTIIGQDGKPVEGQFFKITVNEKNVDEKDEYKDLDRDGIIYVADLKAGEYQVSLEEQPGFVVPASSMPVKVKARVEYVAIGDISWMIKTEEEVDMMAEDAGRIPETVDPTEPTELRNSSSAYLGIDVSRWNEEINWNKVKDASVKYAIIRAGYRGSVTGTLVEDRYFKQNVEGAAAAGIPVGLYFFTQATNEVEAVEEASMVLSLCKDYDITYPIFIDTESAGGEGRADELDAKGRTSVCQAFCETIRSAGYQAGIYANRNWFNNNIDTSILADDIYIWLAEYGDAVTYAGKYHIWQYTSSGRVLGIEGRVDLNLSFLEPKVKEELKYGNGPEAEKETDSVLSEEENQDDIEQTTASEEKKNTSEEQDTDLKEHKDVSDNKKTETSKKENIQTDKEYQNEEPKNRENTEGL